MGSRRSRCVLTLAATLAMMAALATPALAAAGDLDPTFGTGGKVTTTFGPASGDFGLDMAIQTDGMIVVAGFSFTIATPGDFALARYTPTGALDGSFGSGGKVTTPIGAGDDQAQAVAVQSDGKIIAAGYGSDARVFSPDCTYDFALARYTSTGALDGSFGSGGKVRTPVGTCIDAITDVTVQPDGKILAVGTAFNPATGSLDFAMARYASTGALDGTFGSGGTVITAMSNARDHPTGIALQPDGKIVVAGWAGRSRHRDWALARYTPTGALDGSFGSGGKVITDLGSGEDLASALVLQPDGRIVVAGSVEMAATSDDFALIRYTSTGALDVSFGSGGMVTTDFGLTFGDEATAAALQSDGKIIAAGSVQIDVNGRTAFALARYTSTGALDGSFGFGGRQATPFTSADGHDSQAEGVTLQSDGKIVAAGWVGEADFALARYENEL